MTNTFPDTSDQASASIAPATASHEGKLDRLLRRPSIQRVALLVSLGLVILAVLAALVMVRGIESQMGDVVVTYDTRHHARELTIALSEAESNQRGFVLTRDDGYLEPYRRAVAAVDTRLKSLIAATSDDPRQSAQIAGIDAEIRAKTAEMERTLQLVTEQRLDEAQTLIETGLGDRLMDRVRSVLETFIAEENRSLLDRNRAIDESRRWLVGAIVAALAGAVLMAYSLYTRSRHEVRDLESENDRLEARVEERTRAVEEARIHAERERERVEALLQDANHRIGNSLATVSSLLGLQVLRSKTPQARDALEAARLRVHAIASAHRRLRLGKDHETASTSDFIEAVIEDLATTVGESRNVELVSRISPIVVSARDATTLGILVGELVTNALKHAFPDGRQGEIEVALERDENSVPVLQVSDNGVGLPADIDAQGEGGLGSVIVKQLSSQFGGSPEYVAGENGGLAVRIALPGIEVRPEGGA